MICCNNNIHTRRVFFMSYSAPVFVGSPHANQYNRFCSNNHAMASDVVRVRHRDRVYIGPVPVAYYNWGNPFCFMPVAVPISTGPSYYGRQSSDAGARVLIGIAAAAVGGIAIYYTGQAIQQIGKVGEQLNKIEEMRNTVNADKSLNPKQRDALNKVADCEAAIFKRIRGNAIANLVLTIAVVAGAALAIVGAIFAIYAVIAAGLVVGIAAGAALILKWGINSGSDTEKKQAQALIDALEAIKTES